MVSLPFWRTESCGNDQCHENNFYHCGVIEQGKMNIIHIFVENLEYKHYFCNIS